MAGAFERESIEQEIASCLEDLEIVEQFAGRISALACRAYQMTKSGDVEGAMRLVQRIRFQLQFRNDLLEVLIGDLHFLATGNDDFDHEAWCRASGERDYSALDCCTLTLESAAYMAGLDLKGGDHE